MSFVEVCVVETALRAATETTLEGGATIFLVVAIVNTSACFIE